MTDSTAYEAGTDRPGLDHWDEALAVAAPYGVASTPELVRAAARLIEPVDVDVLRRGRPASSLVAAWRHTQSRSRSAEPRAWLAVLLAFDRGFATPDDELEAALAAAGMTLARTRLEVRLRLGGQLFRLGRDNTRAGDGATAQRLLVDAIAAMAQVVPEESALPVHARRGYRGMLGVAAVLLSRTADDPVPLVDAALGHLRQAERLGDTTPAHFGYLAESLLRRYDAAPDAALLDECRSALDRATGKPRTRRLLTLDAELASHEARALLAAGDPRAVERLLECERLLTDALAAPDDAGVGRGFVLTVRGRVRHLLFEHDTGSGGERDSRWLDGAEQDLRSEHSRGHARPPTVVPVLLDRARLLQRRGQHRDALSVLQEVDQLVTGHEDGTLAARTHSARLDSELFAAVDGGDHAAIAALLERVGRLPPEAQAPAAAATLAGRVLLAAGHPDATRLAYEVVARVSSELAAATLTPNARRHVAGHAARLAWMLARREGDRDATAAAARLFRQAVDAAAAGAGASPVLLADAATCWLRLAAFDWDSGRDDTAELRGVLEDSTSWFEAALARADDVTYELHDSFERHAVHARAGEAYLRLHALSGRDEHVARAVQHLQRARDLGSPWETLAGHLADALYRRGRRRRDTDDLREAIRLKDREHQAGRVARENRSVAASAALTLHDITGDHGELTRAAGYAVEAAAVDPLWPWPVLQLAAVVAAAQPGSAPVDAPADAPPELGEPLRSRDVAALERRAAALAARSREFTPQGLGGQVRPGRGVFVLDDRHRLLSRTLVLKRLPTAAAAHERDAARSFGEYLRATGAPTVWQVPEPLDVHPDDGGESAVYVMRRAQGVPLGRLAFDGGAPLEDAVRFLAAFCAWARDARGVPDVLPAKRARRLAENLTTTARRLGAPSSRAHRAGEAFAAALATGVPAVAKRDAHAGNWLVADDGTVVAIDLEASSSVPALFEVAQLLDDYPFLPPDGDGWGERLRLCDVHVRELQARGAGAAVDTDYVERLFPWFVVAHAAAGLARLRNRGTDDPYTSFSERGERAARGVHLERLLDYVATSARSSQLRDAAVSVAGAS